MHVYQTIYSQAITRSVTLTIKLRMREIYRVLMYC